MGLGVGRWISLCFPWRLVGECGNGTPLLDFSKKRRGKTNRLFNPGTLKHLHMTICATNWLLTFTPKTLQE